MQNLSTLVLFGTGSYTRSARISALKPTLACSVVVLLICLAQTSSAFAQLAPNQTQGFGNEGWSHSLTCRILIASISRRWTWISTTYWRSLTRTRCKHPFARRSPNPQRIRLGGASNILRTSTCSFRCSPSTMTKTLQMRCPARTEGDQVNSAARRWETL